MSGGESGEGLQIMTEGKDPRAFTLVSVFSKIICEKFPQETPIMSLDIGSHAGFLTRSIEESVRQSGRDISIIGLDPLLADRKSLPIGIIKKISPSDKTINIAGRGEDLPIRSDSIDCVTVIDSIHHSDYPFDVVRESMRVLKPKGILIIKDHNPNTLVRFVQAAWSDVLGNVTLPEEQQRQIKQILLKAVTDGATYFRAEWLPPYQRTGMTKSKTRGTQVGDTDMPFNYVSPDQWEKIFQELHVAPEVKKFFYNYQASLPGILQRVVLPEILWKANSLVDQRNCLYVIQKPYAIDATNNLAYNQKSMSD